MGGGDREKKKQQDNGELDRGVGDEERRVEERRWLPFPKAVLI